ncbi:hypothetical protein DICVIV_09482 [Dictyocaulus viviparus]|uniref:Uncharacterized protein n=1 Tax=Dictyocaulus viviparus TaxID=29172 RepID=A0A0D8XKW8_DICVI|nr:hypothetical protein DICVIV_09482 [Dictyocaulus viviparus]
MSDCHSLALHSLVAENSFLNGKQAVPLVLERSRFADPLNFAARGNIHNSNSRNERKKKSLEHFTDDFVIATGGGDDKEAEQILKLISIVSFTWQQSVVDDVLREEKITFPKKKQSDTCSLYTVTPDELSGLCVFPF